MTPIQILLTRFVDAGFASAAISMALADSSKPQPGKAVSPVRLGSLLRPPETAVDARILTVLDILETKWMHPVRLPELAAQVQLSESRVCHLFKHQVGYSVGQVILALRLAIAMQLLRFSDLHISEVCSQAGMGDMSNFDHLFERHFGCSPQMLRKRLRCSANRSQTPRIMQGTKRHSVAGSTNK